ncbi:MAG: hypothetical protein O7I42_11655, partial [Alphaproteobacteria bacterium]|nr:hypothetical protein [Alphaproteobacteria bacterium]
MAGLPKSLRKTEQRLLTAARDGVWLDLRVGDPKKDDPANGANWPVSRTIRAEVIYHLLADRPNTRKVHAKGVRLFGARVEGQLDFESARLDRPMWLFGCYFAAPIIFQDAKAGP